MDGVVISTKLQIFLLLSQLICVTLEGIWSTTENQANTFSCRLKQFLTWILINSVGNFISRDSKRRTRKEKKKIRNIFFYQFQVKISGIKMNWKSKSIFKKHFYIKERKLSLLGFANSDRLIDWLIQNNVNHFSKRNSKWLGTEKVEDACLWIHSLDHWFTQIIWVNKNS